MEKQISDTNCNAIKKNRNSLSWFGLIPFRLEMKNFPKFNNFPYNILFVSYANIDGVDMSGSACYYPDFSTFQEKENEQYMTYYNQYDNNRCWRVVIVYDKQKRSWEGLKYKKDEYRGGGGGTEWNMAFAHLTAMGIINGERVKFEKL